MAGGWTNGWENDVLNYELRAVSYTPPATHYIGCLTASPTDDAGAGATEPSGNAYARQGVTRASGSWNAPAGSGATNASAVNFPVATPAGWSRVYALGIWDALTVGNLRHVMPLVTTSYQEFEVTDTTNDDIIAYSHGLAANDVIRVFPALGLTLPAPLAIDTRYFVISTGLTTHSFRVSTTQGGSAVNISAVGAGEFAKDGSFDVVANSQLTFAAGTITVGLD